MTYQDVYLAVFIDRPNRFIANIEIDGRREVCHVKNTGRCRELLIPGVQVAVQAQSTLKRKTAFDLIAVYKGNRLINIDSQVTNPVFAEWVRGGGLFQNIQLLRPESRFGSSRFDFYVEADGRKAFVEVKGATLEEDGVVRFPDAPTLRGVRHVQELKDCVKAGYDAYFVFIVQMKDVRYLEPNWDTHPAFGEALKKAQDAGVKVLALDCIVTESSINASDYVEVRI